DLLKGAPPQLIGDMQAGASVALRRFRELVGGNQTNWTVVAAACPGWAAEVFSHLPPNQQVPSLWDAIARLRRLDQPEPVDAWERHLHLLAARRDSLNRKRYAALKYTGPGTSLTIGLPDGHLWVSGRSATRSGIPFVPNLPTEEVFTMPHAQRVE